MSPAITVPYVATSHGPTTAQIIQEAAFNYSSDPATQKAFMDGAKFWNNYHYGSFHAWWIAVGVYVVVALVALILGTADFDDTFHEGYFGNPFKVLFPTYAFGKLVGKLLFWRF